MPQVPRYDRMAQLFRGDFGNNIYSNTTLLGEKGGKTRLLSYLALYPNGDTPYARAVPQSIERNVAIRRAMRLQFREDVARRESKEAQAIVVARSMVDLDETLWGLGVSAVAQLDLPVIFVAWMQRLQDARPQTTLWYPRITQGRWALARLKRHLPKE